MKKSLLLLLALIPVVGFGAPKAKRVVMIALDGISVEGYLKANTPNIDALVAEGVLSLETRTVMPSVTLPNWTSVLTGSGPEQHGVVDNDWQIDKIKLPAIETDAEGYYPSLFKIVKEQLPGAKTAFYYNWINLFYPYNERYFDEVSYLENDAYIPNYEKAYDFIAANRNDPTVVFLYSVHTDHAGHRSGWMSDEYIRSIEEADEQIGIFLQKLKEGGLYKDSHIFFLSDHGGIGKGHGGFTVSEMVVPWGLTGPGIKQGMTIEEPNNHLNTAAMVLHFFRLKQPLAWTGEVVWSVFK